MSGSGSVVWPVMVVGGFLAVAAIGALRLQAAMIDPASVRADETTAEQAIVLPTRGGDPSARSTSTMLWSDDPAPGATSQLDPPTPSDRPTAAGDSGHDRDSDGDNGHDGDSAEIPRSWEGVEPGTGPPIDPPVSPPTPEIAPVYGIYTSPDPGSRRLGSFTVVGDEVVTSAASIGGSDTIWLQVASEWVEARVAATDALTDVALLDLVDPTGSPLAPLPELPRLPVSPDAVALDDLVMVGYTDPTVTSPSPPAAGPVAEAPAPAPTVPTEQSTSTLAGQSTEDPGSESGQGPDPGSAHGPEATPLVDDHDVEWLASGPDRGWVFSIDHGLITAEGRLIVDPIWANIDLRPEVAGAPLRNRQGDLIGLVVMGKAQVAAIPVGRVADAALSLRQRGTGDGVRLGIGVTSVDGRLEIDRVDDDDGFGGGSKNSGPYEQSSLRPGDIILSIGGRAVSHPDHLAHLAREAGPGGSLTLVIERDRRWFSVELEVGSAD